jgi:Predicted metal-dependent hydrolase
MLKSMNLYDVTVAVSESVPIFSGDPTVTIDVCHAIAKGDAANVSEIRLGVHTGTHVDAPNHFIEGGRRVDQLDMEKLIGVCRVVEIEHEADAVEPRHRRWLSGR